METPRARAGTKPSCTPRGADGRGAAPASLRQHAPGHRPATAPMKHRASPYMASRCSQPMATRWGTTSLRSITLSMDCVGASMTTGSRSGSCTRRAPSLWTGATGRYAGRPAAPEHANAASNDVVQERVADHAQVRWAGRRLRKNLSAARGCLECGRPSYHAHLKNRCRIPR
jgi:hypothetical protein